MYESGTFAWDESMGLETIGLTPDNYRQVLGALEAMNVIVNVTRDSESPFGSFSIAPRAVQLVRVIDAKNQERGDIVESVKTTFRKHPALAWPILIFMGITGLLTAANQVITFFEKIGVLNAAK